ncbi:hypothetical protein ALC56_06201, partial [Trachymyrmex septentrionalis]
RIICYTCNNPGHSARDCRLKLNQQSNSKNSVFYRYCKKTGHLLDECQLRIASNNCRKISHQGNSDGPSKAGAIDKNALEIRPVTVTLSKYGRVLTVEANLCKSIPVVTLMLDTGSGPNIIKETFIPKSSTIDYNNILKLNGINEYPVYIFGKITLSVFIEKKIENPEIKTVYIPRIKITHGIYLGDTIVESVSGKSYLNIISTLDEVEVLAP